MFLIAMAILNGVAAYVVVEVFGKGQRAALEQQGKLVVYGFLADSVRDVEKAESPEEKRQALDRLEDALKYEAETRAEDFGGSKEDHLWLLRKAAHERPSTDFIPKQYTPGLTEPMVAGPLPGMIASIFLLAWLMMLICQGEGLELDIQRRRHPIWEWLFTHPVTPGAVFFAEMLSPIAANPIYSTGPVFFAVLYGLSHGTELGLVAAVAIGVPVSLAAACAGKALEIGVMLRFPPRSRGALIGLMSWLGYATMLAILVSLIAMPRIVAVLAKLLRPLSTAIPWPWFTWSMGLQADGSLSFLSGMLSWWAVSLVMIVGGVWFTIWGAQRGLARTTSQPKLTSSAKKTSRKPLFSRDPLYRKEILWFLRDRGAVVQVILIPITVAGFEFLNLRPFIQHIEVTSRSIAGAAVVFGTYFLWILGPRSLASEGQALWLAQTWPRGLEDLMKAKAKLWFLIATALVLLVLVFAILHSPSETWKVALIAVGWIAFGRSMAEKSVTLVSVSSSSGEPEPIPKGRRWAASLGMLTFSIGVLAPRWELAVVGIVYSWLTAAAMWENFRARLPFLFDPWSEKVPPPPTLMHAMIAISVLVEGAALLTGVMLVIARTIAPGLGNAFGVAQAIAYGCAATIVSLVVASILNGHGVPSKEIWYWKKQNPSALAKKWWWSGEGKLDRRFMVSMAIGVSSGLLIALVAKGYLLLLSRFGSFAEVLRVMQEQMQNMPGLRISYAVIAILFAPFAEEYLFRGLLFRALDREWGGWRALVGSAAFFAIYHPPLAWLPVFLVGLATAFVFKKTGRLASSIVLHLVYNAVIVYFS